MESPRTRTRPRAPSIASPGLRAGARGGSLDSAAGLPQPPGAMSRRFQKRVEDFDCLHCGAHVAGSGYTNHCPRCLWSRHVDVHPGDRAHPCAGLMEPVAIEQRRGAYVLVHRCTHCGSERRNRAAPGDDFDALLRVGPER